MQQVVRVRRVVSGVALTIGIASFSGAAIAGESAGCAAVNRGGLDFATERGVAAARTVAMSAGETLNLTLEADDGARVSVIADATRVLQTTRGSVLVFVAPQSDTFAIHVDPDGGSDARLIARCMTADVAAAERALLDRRNAFIASRDPDRIRIDRPATEAKAIDSLTTSEVDGAPPRDVKASISLSELASAMKIGTPHQPSILDFWFEGRFTSYDAVDVNARQSDGSFSEMYFGSKYMLGPDIMVGYLAQFDQAGEDTLGDGAVKAGGWMAGPYMSLRMGHGLYLDGRAAWGVSETVPSGFAASAQSADRNLMRGKLRGERQVGGWTVVPSVGMSYAEDTLTSRADGEDDASRAGSGRIDVVPEVKRRFELDSKTYLEPRFAAGGFMAFDSLQQMTPAGVASQVPDLHWKAEAGVAMGVKDSMNVQATGGVESGGQSDADTWSGRLQLNMPLGK